MAGHYKPFVLGIFLASLVWLVIICYYFPGSRHNLPSVHLLPYRHHSKHYPPAAAIFRSGNSNSSTVDTLTLGIIHSLEDQQVKDEGFRQHAFNILISNRLGPRREIPDTRHKLCKSKSYSENLPNASVIICFHKEAPSALIRTVYSVIDRTPEHLLHEIILVDDTSNDDLLTKEIRSHQQSAWFKNVRLIQTPEWSGLIRARIYGARNATGQVLIFLDSHCEVNVGWAEPLLARVHASRSTVACPIIDIIHSDTLRYSASPLVRGGFNWGLHFKWDPVPSSLLRSKEDFIKPIQSPTMAGGLFAIDRKYFTDLGEYDSGMNIWGGENLEISFRIWMCGGRLEVVPCSRVGHLFRKRRPYGSPQGEDTLTRNSLRLAHVWMDDYLKYYLKTNKQAAYVEYGDISERVALRKRLGCHSFSWYLKNIYPELQPPSKQDVTKSHSSKHKSIFPRKWTRHPKPPTLAIFQIQLANTELCIESEEDVTTKGSNFILQKCVPIKRQTWHETSKHDFRLANLLCLDSGGPHQPRLAKCHEMGGEQEWRHAVRTDTPLYNPAAGLCLGTKREEPGQTVTLEMCSSTTSRHWNLIPISPGGNHLALL